MSNVGFIGVGYMGYGIAKNILEKNNNLFVIANKNRKPIEKIVSKGANEVKTIEEFKEKQLNVLVKCVTNTPIAKEIALKLANILDKKTLIIDITTHNKTGSIETEKIYQSKNINYIECPVMGGPVQAEEGVLGGIVGATNDNFKLAEPILKLFCKNYFHFGPVGMGAKSKLLNNFLTLGNAALINHMAKAAKKFDLDLKKLFDVAKLGSGNSAALIRVFDALLEGDFKGFKFTATNSVKDLTYIQDLLKDFPEAEKIAEDNKNYFQKAVDDGYGENFISELIDKK
ncbi:NAD(P)-dependent oxidoreductase [Candidatus Pelagibacter sp.]|jgi:3-hydroxyisobutyrate dehydrogenase-like beta-hydroxyacid dehydrogenase|uniref:NAD(P)-dependent oxidoreductase n=1 Tax=uncultured Candidatus Pelagibacter sp. TaxID=372654 RepID=UPI00230B7289|nr:NAD(P)-dependent oxidoreductase [uncultured Candidatus Pelagibacter sp.]MDA7587743.1 NAD(P)-dependent oxidoreductase [Candidatus Pelagibacter sp.]MDC0862379.1 NAD(P)-dependent oxidoreductase [bacterium]MDB3947515.1 NAD(P)-dependent oxidoreductase [Candidatus Pelagibacter sp.]MDB4811269.1 NAD(P)-dependent oxidoreductase [Candidatus Pelagibacter sp.]MDC0405004.1 NAD(P)-dependent oxidoreductase [Candidatus Pelagibacter sp.]